MKTITSFFWGRGRKNRRPVHTQMELPLAGARLTRDEVDFLDEIRRLRADLAGASGRRG